MNRKSALAKIKDKKFKQLGEILVSEMRRLGIPGVSVAVWQAGQEFNAGFGVTNLDHPLPVSPETLFQVGSISKTFTGTLLMQLVEAGKLDLDTPVRQYLPKLKLADPQVTEKVTTRHLLTHTGGWVGDYFNDFGAGDNALAKMVRHLAHLPQITPLGEVWSYNNTGFNIAGRLVEVLTKLPYEKAAHQLLLDPLGLDLSFFYPDDRLLTQRFAVGHSKWGKTVKVARPWAVGRATNPVGGLVSTVSDLLKYARFQMGDGAGLLGRAQVEAMRQPQANAGGRGQIGLTWFIRQSADKNLTIYGHGGATHGQQAALHFLPEHDFAIAALTNSDDGGEITDHLLQWALEIYFGASLPQPQPAPRPDSELAEYAGRYDLPLSAFTLEIKEGYLVHQEIPRGGFPTPETPPGPAAHPVRLAFYEADRVVNLDEPGQGSLGDFLRGADGQIALLRLGGRVHPKVG